MEAAFILELLAGIFFVAAAVPLFRLAGRTQQVPERILGITFLLMGVSYLLFVGFGLAQLATRSVIPEWDRATPQKLWPKANAQPGAWPGGSRDAAKESGGFAR